MQDIPYCQKQGVKVIVSIGGSYSEDNNYKVTTTENGEYFANFLYKAFGPYDAAWNGPRPFDHGDTRVAVDGFDFAIRIHGFGMIFAGVSHAQHQLTDRE